MFCLRSWVPLLIFLTNASPIFVLLFISATYFLNRPCVYCSLLLIVLVISLFDFHADWFEPRKTTPYLQTATYDIQTSINGALLETASLAMSALNGTAGAVTTGIAEGLKRNVTAGTAKNVTNAGGTASGSEWVRALLGKKEWRIPCVDVMVRL